MPGFARVVDCAYNLAPTNEQLRHAVVRIVSTNTYLFRRRSSELDKIGELVKQAHADFAADLVEALLE